MSKPSPFDYVKELNNKSARTVLGDSDDYNGFIINKVFSNTPDSVLYANEANKFSMSNKQMEYDFYFYGLPKSYNRYGKWHKKSKHSDEEFIATIMRVYSYSREKAESVIDILAPHKELLTELTYEGGTAKRR